MCIFVGYVITGEFVQSVLEGEIEAKLFWHLMYVGIGDFSYEIGCRGGSIPASNRLKMYAMKLSRMRHVYFLLLGQAFCMCRLSTFGVFCRFLHVPFVFGWCGFVC